MFRMGVPDVPEAAYREAVANALTHRDYMMLGAVHVQWRDEGVRVFNPGGLPAGVRPDNLRAVGPRPRNPLLADAFKRAGVVERVGRGIDAIFEAQARYGRPAPSWESTTEASVALELPGGAANLEFVRLVREESRERPLSLDALIVLNHLSRFHRITLAEIEEVTQRGKREGLAALDALVERGLAERHGGPRSQIWRLGATMFRRLGKFTDYVRQRPVERIRQEEMALRFVDENGRIARREAATLCQISPRQATLLLQRLVSRGDLVRRGVRRGTFYVRRGQSI